MRNRNDGLRKVCGCPKQKWAKCDHAWHFNYKPRHGQSFRFSLDVELGRRITSMTEAKTEATRIKSEINAGTFRRRDDIPPPPEPPPTAPVGITLAEFGEKFVENFSRAPMPRLRRKGLNGTKATAGTDALQVRKLCAFEKLGDRPLAAITEDDIERFISYLRQAGRAASTVNQYVQLVTKMSSWSVRKKYRTMPFCDDSDVIKRDTPNRRNRRVTETDEWQLLAVAPPYLQRLIIGAIETGCRLGELTSMLVGDVDIERAELRVRAVNAKANKDRFLPISPRLLGVLKMAMYDPTGEPYEADDFVFGELGQRVKNPKKAWLTTVLKAHGHKPEWTKTATGKSRTLSAASLAAYKAIGLHFHDLRHEAGSRFLERGWPLHHVRDMLGHASIDTTSTYLNAGRLGLADSMRRGEETRKLCTTVANDGQTEAPPSSPAPQAESLNALIH